MQKFEISPVGKISVKDEGMFIKLEERYSPALKALDGFSHINVIWWFSGFDDAKSRSTIETTQPYKNSPESMGVFATRSPVRPNPIALTAAEVLHINYDTGIIQVAYIDAEDNTPVLDIKPYTPSLDRVNSSRVPGWCSHWPMSLEDSGNFDWEKEFNF